MNHNSHENSITAPKAGTVRSHVAIIAGSIILAMQLIPTGLDTAPGERTAPISTVVPVPDQIQSLLQRSCFDCHSNSTMVPWYGRIQPVGAWMADHVREGRRELNFDEFGTYRPRRQFVKLGQILSEIQSGDMPLPSYLLAHGDARMSEAEKNLVAAWVDSSRAHLERVFPPDSLRRR